MLRGRLWTVLVISLFYACTGCCNFRSACLQGTGEDLLRRSKTSCTTESGKPNIRVESWKVYDDNHPIVRQEVGHRTAIPRTLDDYMAGIQPWSVRVRYVPAGPIGDFSSAVAEKMVGRGYAYSDTTARYRVSGEFRFRNNPGALIILWDCLLAVPSLALPVPLKYKEHWNISFNITDGVTGQIVSSRKASVVYKGTSLSLWSLCALVISADADRVSASVSLIDEELSKVRK